MLESLLESGWGKFPRLGYTGPGPQELLTYELDRGYFGEVTTEELISITELEEQLELAGIGTVFNPSSTWLKMYYQDRILFISKLPLKYGISFDNLNRTGAIYGEGSVAAHGDWFDAKVLGGILEGADVPVVKGNDTEVTHGSEWNDLLYPLISTNVNTGSQDIENLANFTEVQLGLTSGNGRNNITSSYWPLNVNEIVTRGFGNVGNVDSKISSTNDASMGWRVVLELNLGELLAPFVKPVTVPFLSTITTEELYKAPINVETVNYPLDSLEAKDKYRPPVDIDIQSTTPFINFLPYF